MFHVSLPVLVLSLLKPLVLLPESLLASLEASDGSCVEQSSFSKGEASFRHASDKDRRFITEALQSSATTPQPRRRDFAMGPIEEVGWGVVFTIMGNGENRASQRVPPSLGTLAFEVEAPRPFFSERSGRLPCRHVAHKRRCSVRRYCAV